MEPTGEQGEMRRLLEENNRLIKENSELLQKVHRNALIAMWLRIGWYVLLIGLPFLLYFYVLEPYFELLGSSYKEFSEGIAEVPGWKQLNQMIENLGSGGDVNVDVNIESTAPLPEAAGEPTSQVEVVAESEESLAETNDSPTTTE